MDADADARALAVVQHEAVLQDRLNPLRHHLSTRLRLADVREVIFVDIDGTALNDKRKYWVPPASFPTFRPVLELVQWAQSQDYVIVFLTGRQECKRDETVTQLTTGGYAGWHSLIMYPNDLPHTVDALVGWKDTERAKLKKEGGMYIVACVGDQDMDVLGSHIGEYQARLPELDPPSCSIM